MRIRLPRRPLLRTSVAVAAVSLAVPFLGSYPVATAAADPGTPESGPSSPPGAGFTAHALTPSDTVAASKAMASSVARTPDALRHLTTSAPVAVLIKYDYDALASYRGTVRGYAATSPSVVGGKLSESSRAATSYLALVQRQEAGINAKVQQAAPSARITQSFRTVYGGVAAVVPGNRIPAILAVPGVVAVQRDAVSQPLDTDSARFIDSGRAYAALSGRPTAGAGLLLGNLDTGVWPEHPEFAARPDLPAYTGPALTCDYGDNPLTPAEDPFVCNNKLVGGKAFLATYQAVNSAPLVYTTARDSDGHGSHTASTSAGNVVKNVHTIGPVVKDVGGIAPGAEVSEYRVCGPAGCYGSDSVAAIGQAILDGVDAINFSISGGANPATDPVEQAFLDAYDAGVFVAASAGNSGPGAGTAEHASPWLTTVGASTQKREFASTLTLTADNGDVFTAEGASITTGAGPAPVVQAAAAPYGDALCQTPAPAGTFTGEIVVCQRGGNARVEKGYNVLQGGAVGMILYNPTLADVETDNHWLPAVHLADGTELLAFLGSHSGGITGSFTPGSEQTGRGDVMAAFSSRGPLGNFIKPDITAPGVQILAAMTPTPEGIAEGPPGQYWQAIAGTSMSSPHIAGAALLVKAVHPDWTPGQIKSAIMTQARTSVVKEDLTTPADPFDMGAGRVDVGRAINAPVTISDSTADMAALFNDPQHAIDLNIASIDAPTMPGRVTTTRTLTNVTGQPLTITGKGAKVPADTTIAVRPRTATVAPGDQATFTITLTSTAPVGSQQFAQVNFVTDQGTARLPVAFVPQPGSVGLTQTCQDGSVAVGESTTCTVDLTNDSFADEDVTVTTTGNRYLGVDGEPVTHSVTLAGARPGVPSVADGTTPGGGYLPLSAFGINPVAVGDENITNYDVPPFAYNGTTYSRIGIDSNGYLVAGGGTSSDNECCNLPDGPSPAKPNDILAPFWTDLDGTGSPGISLGTLTDGIDTWIVAQWEVHVYGDTTATRAFQVWLGTTSGSPGQDISYGYADDQTDPGQPYLVGAENELGEGDMRPLLPTGPDGGLVVTSTDPTPGDTLTYDVTATGLRKGPGNVHTELSGPGLTGTTIADTPVTVTPRP